jgi:hypothetical protein
MLNKTMIEGCAGIPKVGSQLVSSKFSGAIPLRSRLTLPKCLQ